MHSKGKIISWDDNKGYGFVSPISGEKQIFIHITAFNSRNSTPKVGQDITYSTGSDKNGRPCVIKATIKGNKPQQNTKGVTAIIITTFFFLLLAVSVLEHKISPVIFIVYLILSLLTYFTYLNDKSAAAIGTWRTPEKILHLLALAGGWPGALIAQQRFRHKTKKKSFRFIFWVTIVLNCAMYVWLLTNSGSILIN